jgi:CheY-like chemotaxis protein
MSKKILLIDDEALITRSFAKLLGKNSFEVEVCQSGQEAIMIARNKNFDLIMCDIRMPGLNGIDTIKTIFDQYRSKNKTLPGLIFITGYADDTQESTARELNPFAYIYKPFDVRDLLDVIRKALS